MSNSWLSLVPVCEPFAYQANLICEDCAGNVIKDLESKNIEDSGDTNDYPQGDSGNNESDSPCHCRFGAKCINAVRLPSGKKIGCPLRTKLTIYGIAYTRDNIAAHILYGNDQQKAISRLWLYLYGDSSGEQPLIQLTKNAEKIPAPLGKALAPLLKSPSTNILSTTYTDLHYVYGGAIWKGSDDRLTLWRLGLSDTGDFTTIDQVLLPANLLKSDSLETLLSDAISEGAWD